MVELTDIKWMNCSGLVHSKKCPKCKKTTLNLLIADERDYGYIKYSVAYCSNCGYHDEIKEYDK